jgi:hypothetical protein
LSPKTCNKKWDFSFSGCMPAGVDAFIYSIRTVGLLTLSRVERLFYVNIYRVNGSILLISLLNNTREQSTFRIMIRWVHSIKFLP